MAAKKKQAKKKTAPRKVLARPQKKKQARMVVEHMKLDDLKEHPENPRKHPLPGTPQWNALKVSLEEDYFDPMVWNKRNGMLVSGHLRRKVFLAEGYESADVVVVDYDDAMHLARLLAANKAIGENDERKLRKLFEQFTGLDGFKLETTGFTLAEVSNLMGKDEFVYPDSWDDGSLAEDETDDERKQLAGAYTKAEITRLFGKLTKDGPTFEVSRGDVYEVNDNYLVCADMTRDHKVFTPLLAKLEAKFPKRKILFIPVPDPLMVGLKDTRVACVMVQPSTVVAAWALTFLKARGKSRIRKVTT